MTGQRRGSRRYQERFAISTLKARFNYRMSMTFCLVIFPAVLFGCTAEVSHRETSQPEGSREEGFVSIFDGKTLEGWKRHDGLPEDNIGGRWQVIDGAIAGDQDPPGRGGFSSLPESTVTTFCGWSSISTTL